MEGPPKVFGIGLSKTGTTSLTSALWLLGYRTVHYPPLPRVKELLNSHDAATDTSIACQYGELDASYRGSKFVLTVRDAGSWLKSAETEFKGRSVTEAWKLEVRQRLFGTVEWEPNRFLKSFRAHNERVARYFSGRPGSLLILNIVSGDGWGPLCDFLGRPQPHQPFPHENATAVPSMPRTASDSNDKAEP